MSGQRSDNLLSMDSRITRRDFFNGAMVSGRAELVAGRGGAGCKIRARYRQP